MYKRGRLIDYSEKSRPKNQEEFKKELSELLNKHSKENGSDTPDFMLSDFLSGCLELFDKTTVKRKRWYDDDMDTFKAPEGSLILSPLASKERCEKLYKEWMEEFFNN